MPPEDDKNTGTDDGGAGGAGGTGSGGGNGGGSEDTTALRKALQAERAKAKAAEQELASLKQSVADGKTDAERVAGQLQELKARADAADMRAMRAEVAAEMGLTSAQAKRLQGDTVEALKADAEELLAAFKPAEGAEGGDAGGAASGGGPARAGAGRPREALRPGATPPSDQGEQYDSAKLLAAVPRG